MRDAITRHLAAGEGAEAERLLVRLLDADRSRSTVAFANRAIDRLRERLKPAGVYVLRTVTLEPLGPILRALAFRDGLNLDVRFGEFDQLEQEIAGVGALPDEAPDFVLVLARLEDLAPPLVRRFIGTAPGQRQALADAVLDRAAGWLDGLHARWPRATLLLSGFEEPSEAAYGVADARVADGQRGFVRRLNTGLAERCQQTPGAFLVDIDAALAAVGRERAHDRRMMAHARLPYSGVGLEALATRYARVIGARAARRRKCVVLDCDNTLWGGIIGEDGMDGIQLGPDHPGRSFVAFQEALLTLHDRGVILALNTKNNEADVLEVLDQHPSQVLRKGHLAAWRINWQDKASNLESLAAEINIGVDSLIFIDDSDFECQLVRERLPQVLVVQTPSDPLAMADVVRDLRCLDALDVSAEDKKRGEMYKAQAVRERTRRESGSLDNFLGSLDMALTIAETAAAQVPRVAQLTQKTNQFNLTTRRYTEADIERLVASPDHSVHHLHLTDRFGEYGITGAVVVRYADGRAVIDTLLMSCRILGRTVEAALLAWLLRETAARGAVEVIGERVPTRKNHQTADLFERFGFEAAGEMDGVLRWRRAAAAPPPDYPPWFTLTLPARSTDGPRENERT